MEFKKNYNISWGPSLVYLFSYYIILYCYVIWNNFPSKPYPSVNDIFNYSVPLCNVCQATVPCSVKSTVVFCVVEQMTVFFCSVNGQPVAPPVTENKIGSNVLCIIQLLAIFHWYFMHEMFPLRS